MVRRNDGMLRYLLSIIRDLADLELTPQRTHDLLTAAQEQLLSFLNSKGEVRCRRAPITRFFASEKALGIFLEAIGHVKCEV